MESTTCQAEIKGGGKERKGGGRTTFRALARVFLPSGALKVGKMDMEKKKKKRGRASSEG